MELEQIQELIKFVAKSGVNEIELETKEFKIIIRTPARKRKGQQYIEENNEQQVLTPVPVMQPVQAVQPQVIPQPAAGDQNHEEVAKDGDAAKEDASSNTTEIKSPMIGTFYRSSSPDKPPFVNIGDTVNQGDVICIVEAMKLFNEIEAELTGKIIKVLVDDATPVEYDQPLFLIEPV